MCTGLSLGSALTAACMSSRMSVKTQLCEMAPAWMSSRVSVKAQLCLDAAQLTCRVL